MNEKVMIRAGAIFSILVITLFGAFAAHAIYSLFGVAASTVVVAVFGFIIWRIGVESEDMIKYRDELYWGGVDIANVKHLPDNPSNITDARDVILVLKERIRDLDAARNEAVNKYYAIKEERDSDAS